MLKSGLITVTLAAITLLPTVARADDTRSHRGRHSELHRFERKVDRHARDIRRGLRKARHISHEYRRRDHGSRHETCGCVQIYERGHYERVARKVRGRGHYERVWVPAGYETRVRNGCLTQVYRDGYYKRTWKPGRLRTVYRRVWVPARWATRTRCGSH